MTTTSEDGGRFTPGPWTIRKASRGPSWYVEGQHTRARSPWLVADVDGMGDENEANARLIAAAPDLLAALEACEEVLRLVNEAAGPVPRGAPMPRLSSFEAWRYAANVIAKARSSSTDSRRT